MYADRVSSGSKRSIRDRLNEDSEEDFGRSRLNNNSKRLRQNDNKWKHDLYEDGEDPQVSNPRVGVNDLRLKLQKKGLQQKHQRGKSSIAGGRQDLREKLSGSMHAQPANIDLPKTKPVTEVARPARKSAPVEVPMPETKKVVTSAPSKKKSQDSQQKGESVDGFLQSLGLEKYLITFQAEEVDMTALIHMTDEDLKALGMPMGPRKKILLALDSRA